MKPSPQLTLGDIVIYSPTKPTQNLNNLWSSRVGKRARVVFVPITPDDVCGVVFEGEHETSYPLASNLKRLPQQRKGNRMHGLLRRPSCARFVRCRLIHLHSPTPRKHLLPLTFQRATTSLHAPPVTSWMLSTKMRVDSQETVFGLNTKVVLKTHRRRAIHSHPQTSPNTDGYRYEVPGHSSRYKIVKGVRYYLRE